MLKLRTLHAPALLLAAAALAAAACAPAEEPAEDEPMIEEEVAAEPEVAMPSTAMATLHDADGNEVGTATFTQNGAETTAAFDIHGVDAAGVHGIHVHETGVCTPPDFKSAGGHFNPAGVDHACPPTAPRHAGDFGNVEIGDDGSGHAEVTTDLVTVDAGPTSVVGRAVILHAGTDDCTTQPTGDAGARLACGVIEAGDHGMHDEAMEEGGMEHEDEGYEHGEDEGDDM